MSALTSNEFLKYLFYYNLINILWLMNFVKISIIPIKSFSNSIALLKIQTLFLVVKTWKINCVWAVKELCILKISSCANWIIHHLLFKVSSHSYTTCYKRQFLLDGATNVLEIFPPIIYVLFGWIIMTSTKSLYSFHVKTKNQNSSNFDYRWRHCIF